MVPGIGGSLRRLGRDLRNKKPCGGIGLGRNISIPLFIGIALVVRPRAIVPYFIVFAD